MIKRTESFWILTFCYWLVATGPIDHGASASEPENVYAVVRSTFEQHCLKCHGSDGKTEGDVNLMQWQRVDDLMAAPAFIQDLIRVLDSGAMPPEDEPALASEQREQLVTALRALLQDAVGTSNPLPKTPIRRMNRFQYSNSVQDLFQLNVVVFNLPERMLREYGDYFQPQTGKMPTKITAGSRPLGKSQMIEKSLGGVNPFPQDLRAEHGFDNRGDHLTLSPLLLESFFQLSRSILGSRDFNAETCGQWQTLFAPPPSSEPMDLETVTRERLKPFLTTAFRRPVEDEQLDRYTNYLISQVEAGESFTTSMKQTAAAVLASPRFFYLYDEVADEAEEGSKPFDDFNLASRLSFFLWGSLPDPTLLELATQGTLHEPPVLTEQVERMLRDRRLKRFCDSFPAQWLQLERIISSVPDRQQFPQFYFKKYHVSFHMMLEPLLLFETLLIENQSVLKFIDSDFSYQTDLLQHWYRDGTQGDPGSDAITAEFHRVPITDRRQGGVITNAAVMTMTSGPLNTKPITRGAWMAGVILNDPPEPPPADVPPLAEEVDSDRENLTLRERFSAHRQRAECASCHQQIDPLGFALENYNAVGIWRDTYSNGRAIDPHGTLFGRHPFRDVVELKAVLLAEKERFTQAFAEHLLSYALGRELRAQDAPALDQIVRATANEDYRFHTLIKQIVLSRPFLNHQ